MFRFLSIIALAFLAVGCASTRQPSAVNQLQIKVAQLERKLEEKDQEISDLRDSVDQMSSQPSNDDAIIPASSIDDEVEKPSVKSSSDNDQIIRVSASAQEVQKALKNAGYYEGAIDGRIGQKTKLAISKFQKDNNLKSDGIIGKQTWSELKTHLE